MRRFECIHCRECPTEEGWNEYNSAAIITLGIPGIAGAVDEQDDGASYDCPSCEERAVATDLMEV